VKTTVSLPRLTVTGGRGRLAQVIRQNLESKSRNYVSLSRSESDEHLALESLFEPSLLARTDVLLHLAWSTLPVTSEQQPGAEWETDLPLLAKLLRSITSASLQTRPHLIFFSSGGAVYGPAESNRPAVEEDECAPIGWYGQGKMAAERLIREFGERHGLAYTILRVSNPYGYPAPHHKLQGIIPFLIESARQGRQFNVWGDGTARKDFLHYTDFLTALELVIAQKPQGTFNLSHGESHTIAEVIALIETATGQVISTHHQPAHAWDVHDSILNNQKLCASLEWSPSTSLAQGIDQFVG